MSTFEKFMGLECITLLGREQQKELTGGGDPPDWPDDPDGDDDC